MSQALRDARRFEETREQLIKKEDRPAFHLSARVGWMNDPNGFSYYNDQYHMFYQYHPYDSHWGPMHWGHAVSKDLIHWEYLPAALAPDSYYDRDGCFSGSAITLPDNRQMLMYTSVIYERDISGEKREVQGQCIAVGDGLDYEKYEENPVLTEADLPNGGSRFDFRDPKVYVNKDGTYNCLIANNRIDHGGQFLLYSSEDAIHWKYVKIFAENNYRIGLMWECPDFFELDGEYILLASAQDMMPKGLEYHNGNGTFYLVGDYNSNTETFTEKDNHTIDYGIDFYAPQTILSLDGRRIMIGWMQNWDTCNLHTKSIPWFGQMSIPRELSVKNSILYQTPIRELESLRCNGVMYTDVILDNEEIELDDVKGRMIDMTVEVEPVDSLYMYQKFSIHFAKSDQYHSTVSFRPYDSTVKIDRKFSGSRRAIIHQRRAEINHENGKIKLRLLLDRFSAELFINDGQKAMSMTIDTPLDAEAVSFYVDGKVNIKVIYYEMKTED